jgi:hypothetical protein
MDRNLRIIYMEANNNNRKINPKSIILPELIALNIPGFYYHSQPVTPNVLSFTKINSEDWFLEFVQLIESKLGKEYFPVMRMSDGEYTFLLGQQFPYKQGHTFLQYVIKVLIVLRNKIFKKNNFQAATLPGVSSGNYNITEINKQKEKIIEQIKFIAQYGVLALHLTFPLKPFQEHFHYPLKKWLDKNNINLNRNNYYPFYFVYALLRGEHKSKILKNKTILIFHSANGAKRNQIIASLKKEGVKKIIWHEISASRSMFDSITLKPEYFQADLVLVGAGVGKFNILAQLTPLNIPCIDAGFVFEVWANDENKWKRPFMVPDWDWDEEKIKFR